MMKSYFDAQMQLLQDDVKQFALKYPEHARHLNLDSLDDRDPNVERLLEGFAYLTGRIQQSIDHDTSMMTETLLETVSPSALLATPSKAIAQCLYKSNDNEKQVTEIGSKDLFISACVGSEKTACKFLVEENQIIYPVSIVNLEQIIKDNNKYELKIELLIDENSCEFSMPSLKLFINGEIEQRLAFLHALMHECHRVDLTYEQKLYSISLRHTVLDENKLSASDPFGIELLKDFFCFRDKFFFIEVLNPHSLVFQAGKTIELCFELKQAIGFEFGAQLNPILLGCVPIINSFQHMAEPLNALNERPMLPLLLDADRRQSICLQELLQIESQFARDLKIKYVPFYAYQQGLNNIIYYRLQRPRSDSVLHHILLSGSHAHEDQCLSVTTKATNSYYPRKYLSIGSIELQQNNQDSDIVGTNITRPTNYYPAITEQAYFWRLIGVLSENYKTLSDRSYFLDMLHVHDLFNKNYNKIEAICEIELTPKQIFRKGVLGSGLAFTFKIDDLAFINAHEIYLFGLTLHMFLLHHIQINHFLETCIEGQHELTKFVWLSEHGVLSVC